MAKIKKLLYFLMALTLAVITFSFVGCKKPNGSSIPNEYKGSYTPTTLQEIESFEAGLGLNALLDWKNGLVFEESLIGSGFMGANNISGNESTVAKGTTSGGKFVYSYENTLISDYGYGVKTEIENFYYDGTYRYYETTSGDKIKETYEEDMYISNHVENAPLSFSHVKLSKIDDEDTVSTEYFIEQTDDIVKLKIKISQEDVYESSTGTTTYTNTYEYYFLYQKDGSILKLNSIYWTRNELREVVTTETMTTTSSLRSDYVSSIKVYDGEVTFPNDLSEYV